MKRALSYAAPKEKRATILAGARQNRLFAMAARRFSHGRSIFPALNMAARAGRFSAPSLDSASNRRVGRGKANP